VVGSQFDGAKAIDMLHGYTMLSGLKGFTGVSEQYGNALAEKLEQEGYKAYTEDGRALKADELSHSTQVGYGDEWVPELWSAEVWRKVRDENVIAPLFNPVDMPSNPYKMPVEGDDPIVYFVPETTDEADLDLASGKPIKSSKPGTQNVTISAQKLALRLGISTELTEDAIVPVLSIYREQAMSAMATAIDGVLLNGDTTLANNINADGATIDPDAQGYRQHWLAFDGLRHLPLITSPTLALNAEGQDPTLVRMRQARFSLAHRYATKIGKLAYVVDGGTYAKLLNLDEYITMDKAGPKATAMTGQIGFVDNVPVFTSGEMLSTDADGKVTDGGNTVERGTVLCIFRPNVKVGYRRRIAASLEYLSFYDSYQLTATVRLGMAFKNNVSVSALYNVGI
jgi:hypothetical protein